MGRCGIFVYAGRGGDDENVAPDGLAIVTRKESSKHDRR